MACRLCLELLQKFALTPGQMERRLHRDLDIHVATRRTPQHGEALPTQAELVAALGARRDFDLCASAVDDGYFNLPAQGGLRHAQGHPAIDIGAIALKNLMGPDRDMDIEVARRRP